VPNQVALEVGEPVRFGDLGDDGVVEAVVPVWCTNGGGTASGQLGQGLVVFTMSHGQPAAMGVITTSQPDTYHTPYFDNSKTRIDADGITVEEVWYGERDGTCCPTGRAETVWRFTGATLVPEATRVTAGPDASEAPAVVEPFTALPCTPDAADTANTVGCIQRQVIAVDHDVDAAAARIFDRLSAEARRRFIDGESAWWTYRLAVCQSRGDVFEGGSAAQIDVASCFLERSREHLADLSAFDTSLSQGR
jgi:uncharacterized protein YecT (DUF1311 family)